MGLSEWARVLVAALVGLGMLVVVPVGLGLIPGAWPWRRLWFVGAVPGAVALWLPRGPVAAVLAALYLLVALALLTRARPRLGVAVCTALVTPSIAAGALVAERAEYTLMGFRLDVLALTEAHFHYAGFAAALVAGLVQAHDGRLGRLAALTVPAGTGLVLAGFFVGEWVELAGAAVLTAGMWLTAWITVRLRVSDAVTRALMVVSSAVLAVTMLLALDWALGPVTTAVPHLSLSWMVATHGLANALGFGLCAILAWRRLSSGRAQ
ncbi:YndJ family protein [Dactylosporangium sp. CS-047395]|uniref:YndJ family protein n=1 Tax=Dactylosporangium sp. CS-047395 TaxID=3239936 RepID=UPI003D943899